MRRRLWSLAGGIVDEGDPIAGEHAPVNDRLSKNLSLTPVVSLCMDFNKRDLGRAHGLATHRASGTRRVASFEHVISLIGSPIHILLGLTLSTHAASSSNDPQVYRHPLRCNTSH